EAHPRSRHQDRIAAAPDLGGQAFTICTHLRLSHSLPGSRWLRSCQYSLISNVGSAMGGSKTRKPNVCRNDSARVRGIVAMKSVLVMTPGTARKWLIRAPIFARTLVASSARSMVSPWAVVLPEGSTWVASLNCFRLRAPRIVG